MKKYPFKFLDAYSREDTGIFFGRDEEIAALYEMVFQSPILLVYGASGTGKTSLIQCGLASKFQSHDWLALPIRRGSNINASFDKVMADAGGNMVEAEDMDWLKEVMEEKEVVTINKTLSPLEKSLKAIYLNSFRPIYLIFDQFEELFILGNKEEQQQFIETVKEILQVEQPVKMIFSIREEYLGHLNAFERAVPQLLRKKLRVEPMNLDKVRQVIVGATSYENSNVHLQSGETDIIAEGIFDKIKGDEKTLTIQLPYLQVFLDKFYLEITKDETRNAEAVFTTAALNKIGDIGDMLRNFLEEQVASISKKLSLNSVGLTIETVWKILSPFATLEGTKEPITKENLYERLPDLDKAMIDATVEAFINSRILRYSDDEDVYEIAHDSLAKRIAEKRSDEEIALLEIKRLIKGQTALKANARETFTEKQLNFIEPYLSKLRLTSEEKSLINESKTYIKTARQKELANLNRRKRLRIVGGFLILALVALVAAGYFWFDATKQKKQAEKQRQIALKEKDKTSEALADFKRAEADKEKLEFNSLEQRANIIISSSGCPRQILMSMESIAKSHPDSIQMLSKVTSLEVISYCEKSQNNFENSGSNYAEAIQHGDQAFKIRNYKTAINIYYAAEAFDPAKKDVVEERVSTVFERINELRNHAEYAERQALNEKSKALEATKEAMHAKQLALEEKNKADEARKQAEENYSELIKSYNDLDKIIKGLPVKDSATKTKLEILQANTIVGPNWRNDYTLLFNTCIINTDKKEYIFNIVDELMSNKARYESVGDPLKIPWFFIALIHFTEANLDFKTHLYNGDPLTARTVHIPAGRPIKGNPPFTWEESATDCLIFERFDSKTDWTLPALLYYLEAYNGFGYRKHKINSPYLWGMSNQYQKGAYGMDGQFQPGNISKALGVAVILKAMIEKHLITLNE